MDDLYTFKLLCFDDDVVLWSWKNTCGKLKTFGISVRVLSMNVWYCAGICYGDVILAEGAASNDDQRAG